MIFQQQLRIPGPTPIPEQVVRAASRPMIDHRGPEFAELLADVTAGAQRVFGTGNDLLVLTQPAARRRRAAATCRLASFWREGR